MDHPVPGPIVFRGQTYASVDEMPAAVRQAYERVLRMLDEAAPGGALDTWEEGPESPPAVARKHRPDVIQ